MRCKRHGSRLMGLEEIVEILFLGKAVLKNEYWKWSDSEILDRHLVSKRSFD